MESAEEAVELLSLAETLDGDDPAVSQAAAVVLRTMTALGCVFQRIQQ